MTKYLNLDEVAPVAVARKVKIGGKEYAVVDMTVENFIATQRAAREIKDNDPLEVTEAMLAMASRYLPDAPVEALRALPLPQLGKLIDFIQGALDEKVAAEAGAPDAEGNA